MKQETTKEEVYFCGKNNFSGERLRRAEEIYYRRKVRNNNVRMSSSQVKEENQKRQFSLYKKNGFANFNLHFNLSDISLIKEANYLFSEDVINKTKELLSTDMNFQTISSQMGQFFQIIKISGVF